MTKKRFEPSPQSLCSAQWNQHPTTTAGSLAGSKGAGRRNGPSKAPAAPKLPRAYTRAEGLPAILDPLQVGRTSRRRRPQAGASAGGWWCGFGVQVARLSLSLPRKSPSPISRPRASPPGPPLSTHPQANLPRLHVKASSAATRKLISSLWLAPVNSGSFRVAALLGGRLPWKPWPWRPQGG